MWWVPCCVGALSAEPSPPGASPGPCSAPGPSCRGRKDNGAGLFSETPGGARLGCGDARAIWDLKQHFEEEGLASASCSVQAAWERSGLSCSPSPFQPHPPAPSAGLHLTLRPSAHACPSVPDLPSSVFSCQCPSVPHTGDLSSSRAAPQPLRPVPLAASAGVVAAPHPSQVCVLSSRHIRWRFLVCVVISNAGLLEEQELLSLGGVPLIRRCTFPKACAWDQAGAQCILLEWQ